MLRQRPIKARGLMIGQRHPYVRFCERRGVTKSRREILRIVLVRMAREAAAILVAERNDWN